VPTRESVGSGRGARAGCGRPAPAPTPSPFSHRAAERPSSAVRSRSMARRSWSRSQTERYGGGGRTSRPPSVEAQTVAAGCCGGAIRDTANHLRRPVKWCVAPPSTAWISARPTKVSRPVIVRRLLSVMRLKSAIRSFPGHLVVGETGFEPATARPPA
jgi:hypothetical protein